MFGMGSRDPSYFRDLYRPANARQDELLRDGRGRDAATLFVPQKSGAKGLQLIESKNAPWLHSD